MACGKRLWKVKEWRERLARFTRAGTSVVEFCIDEGVSTPSFYAWRKRLAGDDSTEQAEEAAAIGKRHGPFAPVRVTGGALGGGQVTVWLRGGTHLEIPLADPDAVRTALAVIFHADAEQAGGRPC